jgi:hypothetical protein
MSILVIPVFAQLSKAPSAAQYGPCGAANGGGPDSTNYYGNGDPCAFIYNVPQDRQIQLLNENPQCTMHSRTSVDCSRAVTGNYGQVRLDRQDVAAAAGGGRVPGPAAQLPYPSAPPPAGVPATQRGTAEQLRQRAFSLIERNDNRDAIPLLLQAGKMGDARAQATLGIAFQDGKGVKPDDRAAAYWFGAAAAQGHRAAQYALASMYEEGDGGLPKDRAKATELYIKSARQGFDKAQMVMGLAYEVGEGVSRSRPQAIALLRESGLGVNIAAVLSARDTPARFADLNALGRYLRKLRDDETARSTANANARLGSAGTGAYQEYFNHNSDYWRQRNWEERPH